MFIEERHQRILEILLRKGRVEVAELSKTFQISEDSVRRDLRLMEEKGFLTRTYGGAILLDQVGQSMPYMERQEVNCEVKTVLAKLAVASVQNRDTILMDGSSTVAKMVPFLHKISGLTIITNSVAIAHDVLHFNIDCQLFLVGGIINRDSHNTTSSESIRTIEGLTVDKTFTGPCSISAEWGLSATTFEDAAIKRVMINVAKEVFILAESGKFGHKSLANIGPLKPEYHIITDRNTADIDFVFQRFADQGLQITVADSD
jgi:DeoR family transcriptional regulator, fructose operon transcriptional repressor